MHYHTAGCLHHSTCGGPLELCKSSALPLRGDVDPGGRSGDDQRRGRIQRIAHEHDPGQFPAPRRENIRDVTLGLYHVLLLETEPVQQQ